ncbi:MAG: hypothetical protein WC421_00170 [Elusimicrobiales bacterium]
MSLHTFLLGLIVVFGLGAAMARSLLACGISLAVASVALSLVLFEMGAPWAGIFELSVCAGLITVLFISTVTIVRPGEDFVKEDRLRFYAMPVFLALFGLAFWLFSEPLTTALVPAGTARSCASFGQVMWNWRFGDIAGQLCMFAAGVLAVKAFFRGKNDA